jgi:hypothetical protein
MQKVVQHRLKDLAEKDLVTNDEVLKFKELVRQ